jgi:hypothetical protein
LNTGIRPASAKPPQRGAPPGKQACVAVARGCKSLPTTRHLTTENSAPNSTQSSNGGFSATRCRNRLQTSLNQPKKASVSLSGGTRPE